MKEFNVRREKLFEALPDHSVALFFSGVSKIVSEDEFYPFVANRHFFYLTGIEQENSVLMLIKNDGEKLSYLFVDEKDEKIEKWIGYKLTLKEAREQAKSYKEEVNAIINKEYIWNIQKPFITYRK